MPAEAVTVTAHCANASSEYNASGKSDVIQSVDGKNVARGEACKNGFNRLTIIA